MGLMGLLTGKKILVLGVANERSIAWAITSALHREGGEIALTYLNEVLEKRVRPLAATIQCETVLPCDLQSDADIENLFAEHGALLKGHFLLSSGLHSDRYLQCALVLARPDAAEKLGRELASRVAEKPDLVLSPAMGGLMIGHEVARALGVRHYFTERVDGIMVLRRGFALKPGEKILVVEDVVTTGKSTKEVFEVIKGAGAEIVRALSIVDRSEGKSNLGVPYSALWTVSVPAWTPEKCPSCRAGLPAVKPGSRIGREKNHG